MKPFNLKKAVNKELPDFSGFDQCDAQEFLTFFLNQLSEDLNRKLKLTDKDDDGKEDNEAKVEPKAPSSRSDDD